MIRRLAIRGFKRFGEVAFDLPGHIVLAGPNNTGKTTVLQAIAAWGLALRRWRELGDFRKHRGGYAKAPIARQAFSAVPLRAFDLLWRDRRYSGAVQIGVVSSRGEIIDVELIADSSEQVYVRPTATSDAAALHRVELTPVFVPAMTGLVTAEPVYQPPKIEQLLGQGKPGDVLRNILVEAFNSGRAWPKLQASIAKLFACEAGNRADVHAPADARREPARDDRPRCPILIKDIRDVLPPVKEKRTRLALTLRLNQLVELAQLDESPIVRLDCRHDVDIEGVQQEHVHRQLVGRHIFSDLAKELWPERSYM